MQAAQAQAADRVIVNGIQGNAGQVDPGLADSGVLSKTTSTPPASNRIPSELETTVENTTGGQDDMNAAHTTRTNDALNTDTPPPTTPTTPTPTVIADSTAVYTSQGGPGLEDGRATTNYTTTTSTNDTTTNRPSLTVNTTTDLVERGTRRPPSGRSTSRPTYRETATPKSSTPARNYHREGLLYVTVKGEGDPVLSFKSKKECIKYANCLPDGAKYPTNVDGHPLTPQTRSKNVFTDNDNWVTIDKYKNWCYTQPCPPTHPVDQGWRALRCLVFQQLQMAVWFANYCMQDWDETQILANLRVWYPGDDLGDEGILLRVFATAVAAAAAAAGGEEGAFDANDNYEEDGEEDGESTVTSTASSSAGPSSSSSDAHDNDDADRY